MSYPKKKLGFMVEKKLKILHILPHLGGGVGKALSSLVIGATGSKIDHAFLLLEQPEKKQFLERIKELGCKVYVRPDAETADQCDVLL